MFWSFDRGIEMNGSVVVDEGRSESVLGQLESGASVGGSIVKLARQTLDIKKRKNAKNLIGALNIPFRFSELDFPLARVDSASAWSIMRIPHH
jgi:hypothetical protein